VWLLDANIDIRVRDLLAEFKIESRTAESLGWKELSNGSLVAVATQAGFLALLTRDRLFQESAARALKQFPQFAIVVIQLRQEKWPAYVEKFRLAWNRQPIAPVAGQTTLWPD
jgi:predicted nuclease of predicted toxin-antitoxin system